MVCCNDLIHWCNWERITYCQTQDWDIMCDTTMDKKDLFLAAEKVIGRSMLVQNSLSPVPDKLSPHTSSYFLFSPGKWILRFCWSILGVSLPVLHLGPGSLQTASEQLCSWRCWWKGSFFFADSQNSSSPERCSKLRWSCSSTHWTGPTASAAKHFPGEMWSQLILQEQAEAWTVGGQARSRDTVRNAPRKPAATEEPSDPAAQPQWLDQCMSLPEY